MNNLKIPIGKRLIKIFWYRNGMCLIPTVVVHVHKEDGYYLINKKGYVFAFQFLGLHVEFWSYNLFKNKLD